MTAGLAMYDTMQYIKPDVSTVCIGQAASAGSLLLMAGAKDKRFSLPNSKIMVHQPSGGFQGQATDIEIHAQEILKIRARLNEIYAEHTGQRRHRVDAVDETEVGQHVEEERAEALDVGKGRFHFSKRHNC